MKVSDRENLASDFQATFGTPQGQRVLWTIAEWAHLYQPSFHPKQTPEATAFREGERNLMLRILIMLRWKDQDKMQRLDGLMQPQAEMGE